MRIIYCTRIPVFFRCLMLYFQSGTYNDKPFRWVCFLARIGGDVVAEFKKLLSISKFNKCYGLWMFNKWWYTLCVSCVSLFFLSESQTYQEMRTLVTAVEPGYPTAYKFENFKNERWKICEILATGDKMITCLKYCLSNGFPSYFIRNWTLFVLDTVVKAKVDSVLSDVE